MYMRVCVCVGVLVCVCAQMCEWLNVPIFSVAKNDISRRLISAYSNVYLRNSLKFLKLPPPKLWEKLKRQQKNTLRLRWKKPRSNFKIKTKKILRWIQKYDEFSFIAFEQFSILYTIHSLTVTHLSRRTSGEGEGGRHSTVAAFALHT